MHPGHDARLGDVRNTSGRSRVHLHRLAGHGLGVRDLAGRNWLAVLHSGVLHCCGMRIWKGRRYHPVKNMVMASPISVLDGGPNTVLEDATRLLRWMATTVAGAAHEV
jgi:hypothetical protein